MNAALIAYLATIAVIGLAIIIRAVRWLRRNTRRRSDQLRGRDLVGAMQLDDAPIDDVDEVERERALASIESQFTVTRRLVVPLVLTVTAVLLALPFLPAVPASMLGVVAAALSVVVGLALRPVIENAFAGLVISFSRTMSIGDTVLIDERYGTIEDISSTHTTVKIWDWRRLLIPNARMLQLELVNYSIRDKYIWANVEFWVSYDADVDDVRAMALEIPGKCEGWLSDTDVDCWAMALADCGVRLCLAAWAETPADAWTLRHQMRMALARELRQRGIHTHMRRVALQDERPGALAPSRGEPGALAPSRGEPGASRPDERRPGALPA